MPGGVRWDWPDGTPVTLEALGGFMISRSDKTAADGAGVLSTTFALTSHAGRNYCVSASWNNPREPVDNDAFFAIVRALITGLPH